MTPSSRKYERFCVEVRTEEVQQFAERERERKRREDNERREIEVGRKGLQLNGTEREGRWSGGKIVNINKRGKSI